MAGPLHPSFWPTFLFLFFTLIPPYVRYAHGLCVSHTLFILLYGWTTIQLSRMNQIFPIEVATARHGSQDFCRTWVPCLVRLVFLHACRFLDINTTMWGPKASSPPRGQLHLFPQPKQRTLRTPCQGPPQPRDSLALSLLRFWR